jgi:iron complex transport system substrate-binding protein
MVTGRGGARRCVSVALTLAVAVLAGCSRGSDSSPDSLPLGGVSTTVDDDPFDSVDTPGNGSGDPSDGSDGPGGTAASGTVAAGSTPAPTTGPPVVAPPDTAPPANVSTTTAPGLPLPDPADVGRIVSLSSTHTETLFALGLGDFVVAVDNESDFPQAALAVRDESLDEDLADLAPVLAFDPDVVILGDDPTSIGARLSEAGVASYSGPNARTLDDVYRQIRDIAAIVGRPEAAEQLVTTMQRDIAAIVASLPAGANGLTFFHEIDPSLFTTGNDSFLSNVYGTLGLSNIAGPGQNEQVTQLTNDAVIAADPDVIILADAQCCAVNLERVAARPGWSGVSAVESRAVVELTDPLALRWGPRVVDLLRLVARGAAAAAG